MCMRVTNQALTVSTVCTYEPVYNSEFQQVLQDDLHKKRTETTKL